jgi:hypothetical protein
VEINGFVDSIFVPLDSNTSSPVSVPLHVIDFMSVRVGEEARLVGQDSKVVREGDVRGR